MKTIWDPSCRAELFSRLAGLTLDCHPLWGSMNPSHMLAHCADPMRSAMGELAVAAKPGPFRKPVLRYLIIYWLPWPKGVPTAPEFLHPEPGAFDQNLSNLCQTIERFAQRGDRGPFEEHPAFGRLSGKDWGRLTYRHLDHHLRQFGL